MTDDEFEKLLSKSTPPPSIATTNCPDCGHTVAPFYRNCPQCEGKKNRQRSDDTAAAIRDLKAARTTEQERAAMHRLRFLRHPDLEGLTASIAERRGSSKAKGAL